jgi:ribonucleotide reductase alpha subunit
MGILRIDHLGILDFITLKQTPTEMTNFNLSVGVTDSFLQALTRRRTYALINPHTNKQTKRLPARHNSSSIGLSKLPGLAASPVWSFSSRSNGTILPRTSASSNQPTPVVNNHC